ncbi:MAG: LysR family transcriptional regulator [Halothiobacillaceae bacterium]|jgi:DNA-binding transcriptional LysR family regulator|nr:LysR family transcriptional regulator [Halothiobacillaceae bacterium]
MKNLTFRQLKIFETVARHLNYTKAAQELHLTQPAVSMQVKQLEEVIGLPLFEQMGRKTFLTEAGGELYRYSRTISALFAEMDDVFGAIKGMERGALSVSVATTASYFSTRLLAEFARMHPQIQISLDVTNRETLLGQLERNERDLVIMGRPPADMELDAEPFMDNPLVVLAPSGHPLAGLTSIPLAQVAKESFVVREQGSGTRSAIERFFDANHVHFSTVIELGSNEAIKQAVIAGLGLGIASVHTLEMELETGRLVVLDVEGFPIMRHWYLVHRKGKRLSPVAQAFRSYVLEEGPKLAPAVLESSTRPVRRRPSGG